MSSPTKTTNSYLLNKIKQLVELNGESVNYKLSFRAVSKNKQPFEALVVSQAELDKSPSLEYQKVMDGEIGAEISNNNNIYQSYFLILKAEQPCEVEIEITKEELPKTETYIPPTDTASNNSTPPSIPSYGSSSSSGWGRTFLIIFGIGAVGLALYWYYKSSKKETVPVLPPSRNNFSFFRNTPKPAASPSPSASSNSSTKSENPILQGLKKLQPK
jgi:phosphotransferase system  glucose/maltose/N-acetylglucosamine-specific IIC component